MKKRQNKKGAFFNLIVVVIVISLLVVGYLFIPKVSGMFTSQYDASIGNYVADVVDVVTEVVPEEKKPETLHLKTPEAVKSIYMTACVASTVDFKQDLVNLIEATELNAIVIDIKDFTGTVSFETDNEKLEGRNGPGCKTNNMREFVKTLHEKGVYVIGRITVFQDPYYSKIHPELAVKKASDGSVWKDYKGLSFIDVGAEPYWDYILEISEEAYELGFDELNYDYIRFPSDGNMKDIYFSHANDVIVKNGALGKQIALENFFKYLREGIEKYNEEIKKDNEEELGIVSSADLFGMVTTNYDDLNIGQVLERALPYFDYIAPMVYPSHYPNTFNGWKDPDDVPYELIHFVMGAAVRRVETLKNSTSTPESVREFVSKEQLRPWIQDFDYGGNYGPVEVREQIQATYDVGLDSWMLWAPSNRYTVEALGSSER